MSRRTAMSSSSSSVSVSRRTAVVEGGAHSGFTLGNATAQASEPRSLSEGVVRDVGAPDLSQRLGDLAARGTSSQGFLHRQENVVGALRSGSQGVKGTRYGVVVAF